MAFFVVTFTFLFSLPLATNDQSIGKGHGNEPPICSFESDEDCPYWTFANSDELSLAHLHHSIGAISQNDNGTAIKGENIQQGPLNNNFYIVLSGDGTASNHYATRQIVSTLFKQTAEEPIAMLITPFFDRTAPQCELLFRYRLLGQRGAELLVATEQLSLRSLHADSPQEEDEDWTRPTLRARFEVNAVLGAQWSHARVGIGTFGFPTRIRVECHPPQFSDSEGSNEAELKIECSVDDLELVNCQEELWHGADDGGTCSEGKLACRKIGGDEGTHCVGEDQICDMHTDCEEGEDEREDIYHCSQVPEGAKCDFEDLRWAGGCAHWRFFSGQAGGPSQLNGTSAAASARHLVSLSDTRQRRAGIPPGEYFYEGKHYQPDHFLFFSSYEHHQQNGQHDIVYSSAVSPPFPRLSNGAKCALRFFYCHTGYSPFQVFLSRRNSPQEMAKPLWAPSKDDHVREPCEWRRATVDITPTIVIGDYSLKLSFAKLADSVGSIAIDDLSLSPGCFKNRGNSRPLTNRFTQIACDAFSSDKKCDEENPDQRWTVSTSGEYRLELAGAAGGTLPTKENTWGNLLVANVRLEVGKEIGVHLGERGECLCDGTKTADGSQRAKLQSVLCSHPLTLSPGGFALPADQLPGCGGGGASLFFYGRNLAAIAGGGGGDFPTKIDADLMGKGHVIGRGVSVGNGSAANTSAIDGCEEAECIDGHIFGHNLSDIRGGKCPKGTKWAHKGGKGGGGASCGPGGGGGGGFKGGDGIFLGPGQPGSNLLLSFTPSTHQIVIPNANPGPGRLLLLACPQALCPPSSNCSFAPPQPKVAPQTFCICTGGQKVSLNGSCIILPSLLDRLLPSHDQIPPMLLLSSLLLVLLSALLSLLCCVQLCRRSKSSAHCTDVHELMAIAAETRGPAVSDGRGHCGGNRISGNPIYEPLLLSPLPQIPRHLLRIEKSIGHGAFGEVFEGYLTDSSTGSSVKVAVKSLPVESARDFGDDFETEARLLSQFKHENIVKFFGVSFEQQPKFIVLEFLEGGDLKNFLRENRPRSDRDHSLKMADLLCAASDVARGCEHIEATRFVHRDIAARNCLLTAKIGRRVVKIADFGMARDIYRNDYYRKGGKAFLPVRWMPPESFLDGLFTTKTDVWAFGVLLWEIFSLGYIPYSGRENHEVMRLIVAGDRLDPPIGVPSELYDIMLCCWNTDAEKRPSFANLVTVFDSFLKRADLMAEPLPPIRHRLANERSVSATPSMSRSGDPHPTSTTSQATVSTVLSSTQEGGSITTSTYESMPTVGDGVCRAVFPPYQTKQVEEAALIRMTERHLETQPSISSSNSSHDSTLHESAGTVKLRHCIRRPPPLSLNTLRPLPRPRAAPPPPSCPASAALPLGSIQTPPANGFHSHANCSPFSAHRNLSLPPLPATREDRGDQDSGIASARSIASADAALLIEVRKN